MQAAATIAAENGATEAHLKAMFGWTSSRMPSLYTRAANRRKLALAGGEFMPGGERDENNFPRTLIPVRDHREFINDIRSEKW